MDIKNLVLSGQLFPNLSRHLASLKLLRIWIPSTVVSMSKISKQGLIVGLLYVVFSCLPLGNMKMQASLRSSGLRVCMLSANNLTCVCNVYRDRRITFVDGERVFVKGKTD